MGEVWKARDKRLDRTVAVKQLKGQHRARFQQEARAIAALNHPHICHIFDIGPDYLVMEYVEGKPLSGPMPVEEALRLASQIADAMEEAHIHGILHRDLKPSNILVTPKRSAKLLDFGLAKQVRESGVDITQTIEGVVLGTAAYMSPEQAQGRAIDERSDIFSFGATLYEMVAGCPAFSGSSLAQVLSAVLRDDPAPLNVPAPIQRVILKCLAKQPRDRFANAAELRVALEDAAGTLTQGDTNAIGRSVAGSSEISHDKSPDQQSVAVLPFANLSADKENEYFSDGLAEEILNLLARIPDLRVIARTSSFMFRNQAQDISRIAATLRVRTILEGSVRRAGSRIRVTAQLVDTGGGHHIWSERYDRELTDVFAVQDEIAAAIAGALRLKFADVPAGLQRYNSNIPAYEAWLKGLHYARKVTPESMVRSKEYFEEAIALDPKFAEAHADLGGHYLNVWTAGARPAKEVVPLIRLQAQKAVDLSLSAGHVLLGVVAVAFDHDWTESEQHCKRFLASGESKQEARATCTNYYLSPFGRINEAVEMLEKMVESDPLNVRSRATLGNHLVTAGAYDLATRELRKALEIDDTTWFAHSGLVRSYVLKGIVPEALRSAEAAYRLAPWNSVVVGQLAALLVRTGEQKAGEALMRQFMDSPNPRSASVGKLFYHLMCEETEAAADWFEKAIEERDPSLIPYLRHPLMKPLQASSRWPALAKMMNLPQELGLSIVNNGVCGQYNQRTEIKHSSF
jgi:serine/threonine-protein kinase